MGTNWTLIAKRCSFCPGKLKRYGAEGGTRTPTSYLTRPSNVRVYQFRHFGSSWKDVKTQPARYFLGAFVAAGDAIGAADAAGVAGGVAAGVGVANGACSGTPDCKTE